MDAQRLLGMLNGGSSAAATSSTSPLPAQHSPRMSSPPATLQSLLSQLQSPQPPSPREPPPHMMSPSISDAGNAAELFRSAGMLPNIPPPPPSHAGGVPGPNHHRVLSPSAGNAQSLLATLMSGSNPSSNMPSPSPGLPFGMKQPVIDHNMLQGPLASEIPLPISPAPPAFTAQPTPPHLGRVPTNQSDRSVQEKLQKPQTESQQSTQLSESHKVEQDIPKEDEKLASPQVEGTASKATAPTASKFHFISPFDVFDMPAPTQPAQPTPKKEPSAVPSVKSPMSSKTTTPKVSKQVPKQVTSPSKSKATPAVPAASQAVVPTPSRLEQVAQPSQPSKKADVPPISYAVNGQPGRLSTVIPIESAHYTFDVSNTNHSGVGAIDEKYQEEIATVKTNVLTAGIQKGAKIAASRSFISYALNKGKVRVIDYTTGVNTAIVLETENGIPAKVADIAICENWLAALGEDGTLGLWKLSAKRGAENSVSAVKTWSTTPTSGSSQPVAKSLKWLRAREGDKDRLIVVTDTEAFLKSPTAMSKSFGQGTRDWAGIGESIGAQANGSSLIDVAVAPEESEYALLHQNNKVIVGSVTDSTERELQVQAPAEGGSWRSIDHTGHALILCSTRNEYALFPLAGNGELSPSSTFFLQDPSNAKEASAVRSSTAVFDAPRNTYWVAIWARASLLAIKITGTDRQAFAAYAEIASGPTSNLAIDQSNQIAEASILYRRPAGISMLTLHPSVAKELDEVADMHASRQPVTDADDVTKQEDKVAPEVEGEQVPEAPAQEEVQTTPASPDVKEAPVAKDVTVNLPKPVASPVQANLSMASAPAEIDYSKVESIFTAAISKSLEIELRQVLTQQGDIQTAIETAFANQEASIDGVLSRIVSEGIQRELSGLLPRIVKEEMVSGVLPQLQEILREEVEKHVGDKLASAILFSVETTVMSHVEKALVPHLGRTFTSILSPAVDKSVRSLIDEKLLPQFVAAVEHVPVEVSRAIHQEMLDVRKDVMIEQSSQATASDAAMLSMSKSLAALSEQVQSLTREIETLRMSSQAAAAIGQYPRVPPGPPDSLGPFGETPRMMPQQASYNGAPPNINAPIGLPMPPPQQNQIISPQPVLAPNAGALQQLISGPEDAEDVFLKAFSSLSDVDLVQFVMSRMPRTAEYLPDPRERPSPLSQAVLLTMVHRLSKCLQRHSTESREYQAVMTWIYRASLVIDPRDDTIQSYLPAVKKTLEDTFTASMDHFTRSRDNSPASRSAGQMMLKIISNLNRPQA